MWMHSNMHNCLKHRWTVRLVTGGHTSHTMLAGALLGSDYICFFSIFPRFAESENKELHEIHCLRLEIRQQTVHICIQLSVNNTLLLYKQVLKPVWTYSIQLWGCAATSIIDKIQIFQKQGTARYCGRPMVLSQRSSS
jgi:hypothetical protein